MRRSLVNRGDGRRVVLRMRRVARGLLGLFACLVLAGMVRVGWSVALAERRSQAVLAQVEGGAVDFARVGPSDWDRVYFFHPYTSTESIDQSLGFPWPEANQTGIEHDDGVNLVVFARDGRVVGWFRHPRNRGELADLANARGFARDAARFSVARDVEGRAVLLAP